MSGQIRNGQGALREDGHARFGVEGMRAVPNDGPPPVECLTCQRRCDTV